MVVLLLLLVFFIMVGALPAGSWVHPYHYGPLGVIATALVVLLVLMLLGRL
jgi:hypothetical protein